MDDIKKICVFCGANPGKSPDYVEMAHRVGQSLVAKGYALVYGGGSVGMMGAVADGVLEAKGKVIGVIPSFMVEKELAHPNATEMIEVGSMHERKQTMADLADGFIALPGGMGTMDELCEITTWAQLGLHQKPIGLLNYQGYFEPWVSFMDHMADQKFLSRENRKLVLCANQFDILIGLMESYQPPANVHQWIDRHKT